MSGNKLPLRMDFVCSNCGKIVNRLVSQVKNKVITAYENPIKSKEIG